MRSSTSVGSLGSRGAARTKEAPPQKLSNLELPSASPRYSAAIKESLELNPVLGRPASKAELAESFPSPYLRDKFGTDSIIAHGWPSQSGAAPNGLPTTVAARSNKHTGLSSTMVSMPLVPRPLGGGRVAPTWRPPSRSVRAHSESWERRHRKLADRSLRALESCHEVGSQASGQKFQNTLAALRGNRFHQENTLRPAQLLSPPPTPPPRDLLHPVWERELQRMEGEWGDMSRHDALEHGTGQVQVLAPSCWARA